MRQLFYGDNLKVLRESIASESVDLIYLDPPFNSQAGYNVIFKNQNKAPSAAQFLAFDDTWTWGADTEHALNDLTQSHGQLAALLTDLSRWFERNSLSAYLVMMAVRLVELRRVLKTTGSIYLHCDATASHYLKLVLDAIFGAANFRSEIVWKGADAHNDAKRQFAGITDRIFFYGKDHQHTHFVPQHVAFPEKTLREWYLGLDLPDGTTRRMTREEIETQTVPPRARRFNADNLRSPSPRPNLTYEYKGYKPHPNGWAISIERMEKLDAAGLLLFPKETTGRIMRKKYLDETKGPVLADLWTDISQLRGHDIEKLGYPTQKPVALLERIIAISCPEGGTVLDPFCGCGTAVAAAEKMNRSWIGIDVTHLSISLIKARMKRDFDLTVGKDYTEVGTPRDLDAAMYFAGADPFQFQFWITGEIGAQPYGGLSDKKGKKGGDTGIDGQLFFRTPDGNRVERAIVSVKAGRNLNPAMVRDLVGTVQREKAAVGVFLCAHPPTKGMKDEAAKAGVYSWGTKVFPKIQILTVAEVLDGKRPQLPQGSLNVSFDQKTVKTTQNSKRAKSEQPLFDGASE